MREFASVSDPAWWVCRLGHFFSLLVDEISFLSGPVCWIRLQLVQGHFLSPLVDETALLSGPVCWICLQGHFLSPLVVDTPSWALEQAWWFCPLADLRFSPLVVFVAWALSPEALGILVRDTDQTPTCHVSSLHGLGPTTVCPVFHLQGVALTPARLAQHLLG